MKKLLFMAALAGATLTGCTSDEQTDVAKTSKPSQIVFNAPIVSGITRTVYGEQPTASGKYDTHENFCVFANLSDGDFSAWNNNNNYLYNDEVTYSNSISDGTETKEGWVLKSGNKIYWPKEGKLTFAAYSPADATGDKTYGNGGLRIKDFITDDNVAQQYDLMYSIRSYNREASTNQSKTGHNHTSQSYDGVDILFRHALASINFKVKAADDYTGTTITVNQISILNVWNKGTFKENITEGDTYNSNPAWEINKTDNPNGTPVNYNIKTYNVISGTTGTKLETTAKNPNGAAPALLIPQKMQDDKDDATKKDIIVQVEYTIQVGNGNPVKQVSEVSLVSGNSNGYFTDGTNAIEKWEMGKRYTYTISIGLNNIIYFSPEVTNWDDITVSPDLTI